MRKENSLMERLFMKNIFSIFICVTMIVYTLVGCTTTGGESISVNGESNQKLQVVTTIFPAYDWTREIVGDQAENVELTLLLDQGVDMHSYQPTVNDIIKIGSCDVFIYVGGESDKWVDEALQAAVNPDMVVIDLLETLGEGVKEEEIIEGMEEKHGHSFGEEHEHENEPEKDEHVWLSIQNAKYFCGVIADALAESDTAHAVSYQSNARDYETRLDKLDQQFQKTVGETSQRTLLFADRFPFRYLTDEYGLDYFAAFPGCEAETEASFATITFLAGKVDELGLPCVLTIDGSDTKIAQTVISNTQKKNQKILSVNSMQSVTREEIEDGMTYLTVMEKNRKAIETALYGE